MLRARVAPRVAVAALIGGASLKETRGEAAEPYKGSDAYETHDGLMVAMVSTFKGSDLKMKK